MKLGELLIKGMSPETQRVMDGLQIHTKQLQKYLAPMQDVMIKQSLALQRASRPYQNILSQYSKFIAQHEEGLRGFRDLAKNLNGLSISFLVQSQVITRELVEPKSTIKTYEVDINKIETKIDGYATKSDIQEISKRIANLEIVKIKQTTQEYKLEINQQNCQEKLLWLTMSGNRLMINDTIAYHTFKTNSNDMPSINSRLINHLISNPCVEFSRKDLIESRVLKEDEDKDFNICLQDMKFADDFAKLFFKASKNTIKLINPITPETKQQKGIEFVELPKMFKKKR
ncbi:MAG: hypothetical protein ACJAZX_001293 [Rickettsiales bacterium]|jgi:hypothetical protein